MRALTKGGCGRYAEIRGCGRYAARAGILAGRAYRLACREYNVPAGSFVEFVDAYDDDERKAE